MTKKYAADFTGLQEWPRGCKMSGTGGRLFWGKINGWNDVKKRTKVHRERSIAVREGQMGCARSNAMVGNGFLGETTTKPKETARGGGKVGKKAKLGTQDEERIGSPGQGSRVRAGFVVHSGQTFGGWGGVGVVQEKIAYGWNGVKKQGKW